MSYPLGRVRGGDRGSSSARTARREQVLGGLDGNRGITTVGVRTHRLAEFLIQRGAADQHDVVVANAGFLQPVDHDLHVRHGGGEQGRHAEDVRLVLLQRRDVFLDRVVDAEVDDLEAGTLEHHRHQVLADVVDVALDGADHDLADGGHASFSQQRPQDFHPALHGVGGQQYLGHEQDAVAEVDAHNPHAFDQRVVQYLLGVPAALKKDVRGLFDFGLQPVVQVIVNLLGELLVVEIP